MFQYCVNENASKAACSLTDWQISSIHRFFPNPGSPPDTTKEGLHNRFPARRAVCCPRCSGGEDAGTSITVLFEPWQRAFAETHDICA
ncbi:hypothetical protein ACAX43_32765, partial [Paraburkholderia sp. IW21]|uniref:hypothetical protein n=1 Tax=Paraburkholderia sp. IW21 TaxID=3242488 RepID=UPI0035207729